MPYREYYETSEFIEDHAFPIKVQRISSHEPMKLHSHEFSEIVFILGGYGAHYTKDEEYPLSMGDVFVINGNLKHGYRDTVDLDLVNVIFLPKRISMPNEDLMELAGYHALFSLEPSYRRRHGFTSRLRLESPDLAHAESILNVLEKETTHQGTGYRFVSTGLFMCLVGHLSRCYEKQSSKSSRQLLRIGEAISHLERHFSDQITLDDLARIAHMSKRNFQRAFHEAMGTSPINYLIRLRIARAASYLTQTTMSISEISYEVGFPDGNYFSRKFREVMGVTPGVFRKMEFRR